MSKKGEVLVAIVNNKNDFAELRENQWYRIPVPSADKWLRDAFPPKWLAIYQTKIFGEEAYCVNYFAKVRDVKQVYRYDIFPSEPINEKTNNKYYQIFIEPLMPLERPVYSLRRRRIIFIPTTHDKLMAAEQINDLYDESPLEDAMWIELKRLEVYAERQEFFEIKKREYALDFSIYCLAGKIDIETDGDYWHSHPEKRAEDSIRYNDLTSVGWHILRFTSQQVREQMAEYCVPKVKDTIDNLGGLDVGKFLPRKMNRPTGTYQPSLFDGQLDAKEQKVKKARGALKGKRALKVLMTERKKDNSIGK
jgi:very-short-patch-repair endonuclease